MTRPLSLLEKPRSLARRLYQRSSGWKRGARYLYYRLLRLQGTPRTIARGVAMGIFAGFFPWFGLQIIIAVFLATLVKGNRLVAAAATWVSNPLTYVPLFAFNFQVGQWLLGKPNFSLAQINWTSSDLWSLGTDFALTLFLGCLVMGIITAMVGYLVTEKLVHFLRHHKNSRKSLPIFAKKRRAFI